VQHPTAGYHAQIGIGGPAMTERCRTIEESLP
jgi:hypothetical protein